MRALLTALVAVALLLVIPPAAAQEDTLRIESVEDAEYPTVELTVSVPAQVTDTLAPDAFAVSENGEPRGRPSLGEATDAGAEPAAPRTVLVIDVSGSMVDDIDRAIQAAADFVRSLRPGSEVAVVAFGNRPAVITPFTSDTRAVLDDLASITVDPSAETALYAGVLRASDLLTRTQEVGPQSIVVLSDGGNSIPPGSGRREQNKAVEALQKSGVPLWAVELQTGDTDHDALVALADGEERVLSAENANDLQDVYVALAADLSRQYLLRYESEVTGETAITVDLSYGAVDASSTVNTVLEGVAPGADAAPTPVVAPDPYTVTVPLLGTTTALGVGMTAVAVAAGLIVWFIALMPARSPGQQRLLPVGARQRPGLTIAAEWITDQAEQRLRGGRLDVVIDRKLESAGVDLRTGEFVVGVASVMVVAYALGLTLANSIVGLLFAFAVPMVAWLMLSLRRDKRQAAFAEQFTDVLQLLAGSLRAGYGMLQGIDAVARDAQEPATSEFRRILLEHRLGRDLTEAMDNCAARMNNTDFVWVVQAISIHRDVGGDLARVLDNIIETVRERASVQRQVRALSTEGRLSARVLTALPFVTVLAIQLVSPGYFTGLTSQPVGWMLIGIAGVMMLIGTFVIRRLVRIEY
jgi:tight adherence protein B